MIYRVTVGFSGFIGTEEEVDVFLEKLCHLREWSGYKD